MLDSLLTLSATQLAKMIRAREITSREVVEAHVRRAEEVHPIINAICHDRFAQARAEADAADRREPVGVFHGVPITVKECFGLAGMRKTSGLVARRDLIADEDATCAARLRATGAIPIGVTNVSELMMWMETYNKVYGRTNNPYDPTRTVGGSSGGEGAIIGAGASPLGLGADIGGSIRMPAFFNGVFGHKPTGGLVPLTGHWPMAENAARRFNTCGPLARRAEDLWPALTAIAGPDGHDDACRELPLHDPASVALSELTIYDVEDNGVFAVDGELKIAQRAAAAHLASKGARVVPLRHAGFARSFDIWSAMMDEAAETSFSEHLGNGHRIAIGRAFAAWALGRSPHTLPALGLALLERIAKYLPGGGPRAVEFGRAFKAELETTIGPRGAILYPPYPEPAPKHYRALLPPLKWQYTAIWNVLEFPVTQVPLGLSRAGLPLGVQVASVPGNDHVTVAIALELERRFGGWVPPPSRSRDH
jgi:fatty acid amide hydrolase 2